MQQPRIVSRLIGLLPRPVRTRAHVRRHLPLHDVDSRAQLAAEAAGDQGKFWQVHDADGCAGADHDSGGKAGPGGVANIRSELVGVSPALGPVPAIYVPRSSRREESR